MATFDNTESHQSKAPEADPIYDNFYSPENRLFYAEKPYKPLNSVNFEIRMLTLLPPYDSENLSFALHDNVPLSSVNVRYTAVSYCAGNPRNTAGILVDGLEFNAFANLGHALNEIVAYWKKKEVVIEEQLLWVDQVYINQSDLEERSNQVKKMRDIYTGAERVLVCLSDNECTGLGLQLMIELHELLRMGSADDGPCPGVMHHQVDPRSAPNPGSTPNPEYHIHYPCRRMMMKYLSSIAKDDVAVDLVRLVESEWWTRCWICQEFIVARDVDFLYAGASMNWQSFDATLYHLIDISRHNIGVALRVKKSMNNLSSLLRRRRDWTDQAMDLKVWLHHARKCESSDPRDKIFAFLGLASDRYKIGPDYSSSRTMQELWVDVAKRIIEVDMNVDLLRHATPWRRLEVPRPGLPTWVPDWGKEIKLERIYESLWVKTPSSYPPRVIGGTRLMVEGIKLDNLEIQPGNSLRDYFAIAEDNTIWYLAPTMSIFRLRKVDTYWLLSQVYNILDVRDNLLWEAFFAEDSAWFLEQGLEKEIIEIR